MPSADDTSQPGCVMHVEQNAQAGKSAHFNWPRVFGRVSPAVLLRQLYADIFEFSNMQERAVRSPASPDWIDSWFAARVQGTLQLRS